MKSATAHVGIAGGPRRRPGGRARRSRRSRADDTDHRRRPRRDHDDHGPPDRHDHHARPPRPPSRRSNPATSTIEPAGTAEPTSVDPHDRRPPLPPPPLPGGLVLNSGASASPAAPIAGRASAPGSRRHAAPRCSSASRLRRPPRPSSNCRRTPGPVAEPCTPSRCSGCGPSTRTSVVIKTHRVSGRLDPLDPAPGVYSVYSRSFARIAIHNPTHHLELHGPLRARQPRRQHRLPRDPDPVRRIPCRRSNSSASRCPAAASVRHPRTPSGCGTGPRSAPSSSSSRDTSAVRPRRHLACRALASPGDGG